MARTRVRLEQIVGLEAAQTLKEQMSSVETDQDTLQSQIDDEKTARNTAISDLQTQINGLGASQAKLGGDVNQSFAAHDLALGGHILPNGNSIQNIGSPTNRFKALYVDEAYLSTNTLYIGDTAVMGTDMDTIQIKADPDQSITMKTTGTGQTKVTSENGVELSTSGMNADIKVQATGNGSRVVVSATNEVSMAATNIILQGDTDLTGPLAVDDITVRGNMTVLGTTTTVNSQSITVSDNIIEVNKGQVGSGVTAGTAGLKVDRGDVADYFMVFDEADDMFKVGMAGQLETIASQPWVANQISPVQTELTNYKSSNDTRVTNVESKNTAQDNRLTSIESEISTARGASANLDARLDGIDSTIASETTARQNADSTLQTNIDGVSSSLNSYKTSNDARATDIESKNTAQDGRLTSIESEISTARGASVNLDTRLDAQDTRVGVVETNLSAEVTRAKGEESRIEGKVDTEATNRSNADTAIRNDFASTAVSKGASLVGIQDSAGVFTATTVEGALKELDDEVKAEASARSSAVGTVQTNLDNHINDTVDAHDASAISIVDAGAHFTSTHVEGALTEEATARKNFEARRDNPHQVTAAQIGAANILTELKTVDGTGSGLDAGLLEGKTLQQILDMMTIIA